MIGQKLSAQLAVLSACQTGEGESKGGDGLLGFAWAFRAAGCPAIVASQWSVDDKAIGQLMTHFYQELKNGKSRDEALRQAMLSVKNTSGEDKPYYRSAFQVIGDTSPLKLP